MKTHPTGSLTNYIPIVNLTLIYFHKDFYAPLVMAHNNMASFDF